MLSSGSPAALNASLQPLGVFTAAVEPVSTAASTASALSTEPPATAPKPTSSTSHADLHQFARPPSRESSESPRRQLQILEPQERGERMPTRRNRTIALPDVTSSAEPVIVLDDDETPPEHVFEQF